MYRRFISLLVFLSFITYLAGCTVMRCVSPDQMSEVKQESSVWVTTAYGTRYEMKEPSTEDSKLVGFVEGYGHREIDSTEIKILEMKELDKTTTIALGVFGVVGAIALIDVLSNGGGGSEPCPT